MDTNFKKIILKASLIMLFIGFIFRPGETMYILAASIIFLAFHELILGMIALLVFIVFSPFIWAWDKIKEQEKEEIEQQKKQRDNEDALLIERSKLSELKNLNSFC